MKKILLVLLAASVWAGCGTPSGVNQDPPKRMVHITLRVEPIDQTELAQVVTFYSSSGPFDQRVVEKPADPTLKESELRFEGRVFEITPESVRLSVKVTIREKSGYEPSIDLTVLPTPGTVLTLRQDNTRIITLLVYVIPGPNDPERDKILELSPLEKYQYTPPVGPLIDPSDDEGGIPSGTGGLIDPEEMAQPLPEPEPAPDTQETP